MTLRTIAVVFLALFCGASMAFALFRAGDKSGEPEASVNTEFVVVAARPVPRFQAITEQDLELRSCSKEWVAENAITNPETVIGLIASTNLFEGDVITEDKVSEKGPGSGVAVLVAEGMRAYTIHTNSITSSVAGFIMPGNKVDVLLNTKGSIGDVTGGGSTSTLLQAIKVLAVAQLLDAPEDFKVAPKEMTSVTLEVTPQQANELDVGQAAGQLTLSLRNPDDDAIVKTEPTTMADIRFLGGHPNSGFAKGMVDEPLPPPSVVVSAEELPRVTVVTLRGGHRGRVTLSQEQNN